MEQPTPSQAAAIIADVPDLHKTPSARVVGLTWMVWGLAFGVGLLAKAVLAAGDPIFVQEAGGRITGYPFEEQMFWFVVAMVAPVVLAAFVTTRIWSSQAFLPAGRPGLVLAAAAFGAVIAGYLLMWVVGFIGLLSNELMHAALGWSIPFTLRGGLGGYMAVAAWAAWFGMTKWNHPTKSRRVGVWPAVILLAATLPLGVLADLGDRMEAVVTVLGAFLIIAAFTWLGARLYARG